MCVDCSREISTPIHVRGHTLLELLIAFSLGLLVMLAAFSLYRAQRDAFEQSADRARLVEAGLSALYLISTHLRLAGFAAPFASSLANQRIPAVFGCTAGRPAGAIDASICTVDQRNHLSDGVEVRYLADTISTWPSADDKPTDCLGQAIPSIEDNKGNKTSAISVAVNRFFVHISPSTGKPELYCEGSGQLGMAQPVVEGIEHLRVRYRLVDMTEFVDAAAISLDQWRHVATVELCVVVRGARHRSIVPYTYVNCDGTPVQPKDALHRKAFTSWVTLRNRHRTN